VPVPERINLNGAVTRLGEIQEWRKQGDGKSRWPDTRRTVTGDQFDSAAATNRDVVRYHAQFVTVCRLARLIDVIRLANLEEHR
jgi:hypothetical protein